MSDELKTLQRQSDKIRGRIYKLETAERDQKNAAMVGHVFKYSNAGGHDGKRWWLYAKVLAARDGSVITFEFQTMPDGETQIRPKHVHYNQLLGGFDEIPRAEFNRAWKLVKSRVANFDL